MDDLEIDRTLRATLSENPSPDFVARVRTTLAEAPRPSIVAGWLKPAGAVACAVLMIAVSLPREEVQQKQEAQLKLSPTEKAPSTAGLKPSTTTVQAETAAVVVPTFRSAKSAKPAAHPQTSNTDEPLPEVLIASEDVEALRQLLVSLNDHTFVASFDETPASTPWVMTDLRVAPLGGEALDPTAVHNN